MKTWEEPIVSINSLANAYLDYVNNYITTAKFAEDRGLTVDQAHTLIVLGRACHKARLAQMGGKA